MFLNRLCLWRGRFLVVGSLPMPQKLGKSLQYDFKARLAMRESPGDFCAPEHPGKCQHRTGKEERGEEQKNQE